MQSKLIERNFCTILRLYRESIGHSRVTVVIVAFMGLGLLHVLFSDTEHYIISCIAACVPEIE